MGSTRITLKYSIWQFRLLSAHPHTHTHTTLFIFHSTNENERDTKLSFVQSSRFTQIILQKVSSRSVLPLCFVFQSFLVYGSAHIPFNKLFFFFFEENSNVLQHLNWLAINGQLLKRSRSFIDSYSNSFIRADVCLSTTFFFDIFMRLKNLELKFLGMNWVFVAAVEQLQFLLFFLQCYFCLVKHSKFSMESKKKQTFFRQISFVVIIFYCNKITKWLQLEC